jgi:hypothetical protein
VFKTVVLVVVVIVVVAVLGILGLAATRPDDFRVQRSVSIKAPPEKIIALVDNFHRWADWSPYEKLDPAMQRTLSGAEAGPGAVYEWSGSGKVGAGRMEILAATPSQIVIKLDFIKPFEGHNMATFTLQPNGDGTDVTWAMSGPTPFIAKIMGLFFDMDTMIGKDFETGLANLKAQAEA